MTESSARLARLVCAEVDELGVAGVETIARQLHEQQVAEIAAAIGAVAERYEKRPPVIALGTGAAIAREAAEVAGVRIAEPGPPWTMLAAEVAPAVALSLLSRDG